MIDAVVSAPLDLSVILVTWNALALTRAALHSIHKHTRGVSYEVLVIDNATSRDDTAKVLPIEFPWVRLIVNQDNLGFSKANNEGMRHTRGRYVLLLNNDTLQIENALGTAVRYMDDHPDVGALGIMHRNADADRSYQMSCFPFPHPWLEILALLGLRGRQVPAACASPPEQDVDWVCGSFLLMRQACLERVGELDERFFMYDEDIDWCLRARRAGWKVRYWPGASMVHIGSAVRPFMTDKTLVHFRSHLSYVAKNESRLCAALFYLVMLGRLSLASAKQLACWLLGIAPFAEFRLRWRRQVQFFCLRPSRAGV
jgi:GT2 family glycosyltransferase